MAKKQLPKAIRLGYREEPVVLQGPDTNFVVAVPGYNAQVFPDVEQARRWIDDLFQDTTEELRKESGIGYVIRQSSDGPAIVYIARRIKRLAYRVEWTQI